MSKELETLEEKLKFIENYFIDLALVKHISHEECPNIATWVKKELRIDIIEKLVKTIKIINKLGLREIEYILCVDYETYCLSRDYPISEKDFNIVNEVLTYD